MNQLDPEVLAAFIEDRGLSHRKNSVSYIFDCPRCGKKDKLYIRRRDGQFICWFCAETSKFRGRAEYALSELAGLPLVLVQEALYGALAAGDSSLDLGLEAFGDDDGDVPILDEPAALAWPLDYYPLDHPHAERGRTYLAGRGVPADVALAYDVRYCPLRQRVVFPVHLDGRLIGWQERLVVDNRLWDEEAGKWSEVPKVLSSRGIPRERVVMFSGRLAGSSHVVLTEGPMDALKAHWCGGNVATMGKAVSRGQVELLRRCGVTRVYLGLDPDAADESMRLLREFSDLECYGMFAPEPWKDLGAMPMDAVLELYRSAPRLNPSSLLVFLRR